jgi:quercetin dioxygenase-like cupin family protein
VDEAPLTRDELLAMAEALAAARRQIAAIANRSVRDRVVYRWAAGGETEVIFGPAWQEYLPGVHGKAVDTASEMTSVVLKTGAAGTRVPTHSHRRTEVLYVLEGQLVVRAGEEKRIIETDGVISIPGGVLHSITFAKESMVLAKFVPRWLSEPEEEAAGMEG